MKTVKKVLMILCILVIIVGMFILGKNDLNYQNGYSRNILVETAKQYTMYIGISTAVILVYFVIRYSKQGIIKVIVTSILRNIRCNGICISSTCNKQNVYNKIFLPNNAYSICI